MMKFEDFLKKFQFFFPKIPIKLLPGDPRGTRPRALKSPGIPGNRGYLIQNLKKNNLKSSQKNLICRKILFS